MLFFSVFHLQTLKRKFDLSFQRDKVNSRWTEIEHYVFTIYVTNIF